jgi:predicted transcriptional regulator of viral defense system
MRGKWGIPNRRGTEKIASKYPKKLEISLESGTMREILDTIETPYVDCQTLLARLSGYQNPRDWISRMVQKGELWRLKNGFFLIGSRFLRGHGDYPYEQIANLLYGPSYVSLEWALSFYNFIPERVSAITSVTIGSSKAFDTPIGNFTYRHVRNSRYCLGIDRKNIPGQVGGFLIATPEKALADWVYFTCNDMDKKELLQDLLEAKRIDKSTLQSLDNEMMEAIAHRYNSAVVRRLYSIIREL